MQGGGSLGDQKLGCGMEHPTEVCWHGQVCLRNTISAGSYRGASVSVCTQEHRSGHAPCTRHRVGATESHGLPSSPSADWRAESGVAHGHHVQGCHTHPLDTDLEISLKRGIVPRSQAYFLPVPQGEEVDCRNVQKCEAPAAREGAKRPAPHTRLPRAEQKPPEAQV